MQQRFTLLPTYATNIIYYGTNTIYFGPKMKSLHILYKQVKITETYMSTVLYETYL